MPYVGPICLGANESHIYPNVCNIWVRSDGRVERKRGYRHTDSWHEWAQDNFYGRSATKRIVIKEPSLDNDDVDGKPDSTDEDTPPNFSIGQ